MTVALRRFGENATASPCLDRMIPSLLRGVAPSTALTFRANLSLAVRFDREEEESSPLPLLPLLLLPPTDLSSKLDDDVEEEE